MNLDELRSVRDEERESGTLQPLRPSFYADARTFIEEIRDERDQQAADSDDPFSDPAVARLTDRLESAEDVLESIFENRIAKLLKHAATAVAGDDGDPPSLTNEERELYTTMVTAIRETKRAALEGEPAATGAAAAPHSEGSTPASAADEAPAGAGTDTDPVERLTVRVTEDVGTILGIDEREYELKPGDVVSLPLENARALIEREAAVAVEE